MITRHFTVALANSPSEAPKYSNDTELIKIEKAIVVKGGMNSGKSSVDIQCIDNKGNKYLIFTTGELIKMLAASIVD